MGSYASETQASERSRKIRALLILLVFSMLVLAALICGGQLALLIGNQILTVDTSSHLKADYSPWGYGNVGVINLPGFKEDLENDQVFEGVVAQGLVQIPDEDIPSGSFWPTLNPTGIPVAQISNTPAATASELPPPPPATATSPPNNTATAPVIVSATPTITATRTPTRTATATVTATATFTRVPPTIPPPTRTPEVIPSPTRTSTPTRTPVPTATLTFTPLPTRTNTPVPTKTPTHTLVPPTRTSTPTRAPTLTNTLPPTSTRTTGPTSTPMPTVPVPPTQVTPVYVPVKPIAENGGLADPDPANPAGCMGFFGYVNGNPVAMDIGDNRLIPDAYYVFTNDTSPAPGLPGRFYPGRWSGVVQVNWDTGSDITWVLDGQSATLSWCH